MLSRALGRIGAASPPLRRALWRMWYDILAKRFGQAEFTFMNYGYSPEGAPALVLESADERDRYPIQLYQHVTETVDLSGTTVLEVGCGRGGGSSYLARYRQPAAMTGVDLSPEAITLCTRRHQVPGLSFQLGDAESLPFAAGIFDAVVNVESSHCYGSMPRFLSEVKRVLRPGGHFLWADMRRREAVEATRTQFAEAGLECLGETPVTPGVLRALDQMTGERSQMVRKLVPGIFARAVEDFAGVKGSRVYESLRAGDVEYLSAVLRKPA